MRGAEREKTVNIGIRKNSGTSGKGYRFSADIPAHWARVMGFDPDNRRMKLEFEDNKIIISKATEE